MARVKKITPKLTREEEKDGSIYYHPYRYDGGWACYYSAHLVNKHYVLFSSIEEDSDYQGVIGVAHTKKKQIKN